MRRRRWATRWRERDDGYALAETLVTIAIFVIIMTSLATFLVNNGRVTRKQADMQTAVQIAATAMEDASLLPGAAVLLGRTKGAVSSQWQQRPPIVDQYITAAEAALAWTDSAVPAGVRTLPTTQEAVTLSGEASVYRRHWFVGRCWQGRPGGSCVVVPPAQQSTRVAMFRLVVAVVWPSVDCGGSTCSYATEMLTSADTGDPLFY